MKFIVVNQKNGRSRSFNANKLILGIAIAGLLGVPAALGYATFKLGMERAGLTADLVSRWRQVLIDQGKDVEIAKRDAEDTLEASALRLAQLQAKIVRLDALGERLTNIAKLDEGEFDFTQAPALGGPESSEQGDPYTPPAFMDVLAQLAQDIDNRELQLSVLETLLTDRKMQRDVFIAGRPVGKGWMSSRFGRRTDPINGKLAWHNGVDFAGKQGADVISVAAGVVVHAGPLYGYGEMVEINHGGGFSTRYGHHQELFVKVGDIVKKGQIVGLMGSSGRSTGPHVHFEVYKNGRAVDPSSYIHRASR
ncbi:MAG: M23 family metallopeptidase [Gammaproteobacteria bacterium]|nr:M23 family metallopeptidase [Gammaproteobacteria bacterium]